MMVTLIKLLFRDDYVMSQLGPKKDKYDKILLMYLLSFKNTWPKALTAFIALELSQA